MILGGIKSSCYMPQTYTVLHISCMLINMKGKKTKHSKNISVSIIHFVSNNGIFDFHFTCFSIR